MAEMDRRQFIKTSGFISAGSLINKRCYLHSEQVTHEIYSSRDPWLEINLGRIKWNVEQIRKRVKNKPIMAVIKNNAYGLGLVGIGKFLDGIGIRGLAVGKLQEAAKLRKAGIRCLVLNFGPFAGEEADWIISHDISQAVYTDDVIDLNAHAQKLRRQARVHIQIDTGMGRIGVPFQSALPFIEEVARLEHVEIEGMFTGLTDIEEFNRVQIQRLIEIGQRAKQKGISVGLRHASSSGNVLFNPDDGLDMVRPGICIYGHYPEEREAQLRRIDLKPALSMKAKVSYVKALKAGDSLSYYKKYKLTEDQTIATAGVGYASGYPHAAKGKAHVLINGERMPVIADVSANHFYVKVTGKSKIHVGAEIVLIGRQGNEEITAEELAKAVGTSNYKIITLLNPLLKRIYTS